MPHNELPLFYVFHFYLFGIIAVASALTFVTRRSPVAGPLFNQYLLAFEVTSVLLLAAVVGAVVLGKRRESAHAR